MKDLSNDAGFSATYTNHSICATCITSLDAAGFESCHIISVSSHKSETTVHAYAKKCPENKKFEISEALSTKITAPGKPPVEETLQKQDQNPRKQQTFPDMFELMETDVNDNEILSQFLDAMEKAIATTSSAETVQTPEANIPGALQNVP